MKMLRFWRDSTPTMKSTDMVRVRQPSISRALDSTATAYTISNQTPLSDHISVVNAPLPAISCWAMSQLHGLPGPYSSRRFGSSRSRNRSQAAANPMRTTAL